MCSVRRGKPAVDTVKAHRGTLGHVLCDRAVVHWGAGRHPVAEAPVHAVEPRDPQGCLFCILLSRKIGEAFHSVIFRSPAFNLVLCVCVCVFPHWFLLFD